LTRLTLVPPQVDPDLILRLQKYKKLEAVPAPDLWTDDAVQIYYDEWSHGDR